MGNLLKSKTTPPHAYIEIILLSLIIPMLGLIFSPNDIFFLQAEFPWIILSPLLVSLRYGTISGIISLFIIVIALLLLIRSNNADMSQFPLHTIAGMIILSLIAGSIIEAWKQRFKKLSQEKTYMEMRLKQVDNAYRVLQASHAQLEDKFVEKTLSLRQSLALIQTDLNQYPQNPLKLVAQKTLDLLAQFEWLEIAAVYAIDPKIGVVEKPLVSQGKMAPLMADDELLQRCLKTGKPSSISKSTYLQQPHKIHSNLIAAIPIVDAKQKIWCVLAVRQMQFTEFHQQNINLLSLIGRYTANLLANMKACTKLSHWKQAFIEIDSALKIITQHRLDAHLVAFNLPNTEKQYDYCNFIDLLSAGLNQRWRIEDSCLRLLVLVPISTPKDNQHYMKMLQQQFTQEFKQTFKQSGIRIESTYFKRYDSSKRLADILLKVRQL
jgi:hypothetical protein